jgi:toxin-antitoxin system PIN domain toxin
MPRSTTFLPDINVWVALASARHIHNQAAARWFDGIGDGQAAFCRVTQMGLLRLLTNSLVMGADTVVPSEAWRVYKTLSSDPRVHFSPEPPGLDQAWQALTRNATVGQSRWTDTYLQAFAQLRELSVVAFDRGFQRLGNPEALILS